MGATGRVRVATVVLAVIVDGLLFGLAHGEWVQLAGLAVFGMVLAAISYRTGRLGMNFLAHATFNSVAILALVAQGTPSSTEPAGPPRRAVRCPYGWPP